MEDTRPKETGIDWPIVAFFTMAYAIAWSVFLLFRGFAQHAGVESTTAFFGYVEAYDFDAITGELLLPPWLLYLLSRVVDFSFSIAGVALIAVTAGRAGLSDLGRRLVKWRMPLVVALAALIPFFLYLMASLLMASSDVTVRESLDLSPNAIWIALFGIEAGILFHLFFRGALGEELGLRGFALPRLQERHGAVRASLIIGVLWYAWHLPILVERGAATMVLYGVIVILLTFIFTWLYNGSGGSLIPGLIFHAIQNSEDAFERMLPGMKDTSWEAPASVGLLLTGILFTVLVVRGKRPTA